MLAGIDYRTFDELLDSVRADIPDYDIDNRIKPEQLIKVAARCNYLLGVKVSMENSVLLKVSGSQANLPLDLDRINFALFCEKNEPDCVNVVIENPLCQINEADIESIVAKYIDAGYVNSYSTNITLAVGDNNIVHNLNTQDLIIQVYDSSNNLIATKISFVDDNEVNLISEHIAEIKNVKIVIMGKSKSSSETKVELIQDAACTNVCVKEHKNGMFETYDKLTALNIVGNRKDISPDSFNIYREGYYNIQKKGMILVANFDKGDVYINYQSNLVSDTGEMMVPDHPLINEYLEYSLKERIFENLWLRGEDVKNRWDTMIKKRAIAQQQAFTYVRTPEFNDLRTIWEENRKANYRKYFNIFKTVY